MERARPLVIGIGEILWDLLPAGKQLGGAPANFAYHAHALGADALVVSRVGQDALGRAILDRLAGLGLRTDGIGVDPAAPTGTVTVALDAQGVPTFTIHENVAWDLISAAPAARAEAARAAAICFGSLAQRHPVARAVIREFVGSVPAAAWRVFDINLRQHYYSREIIEDSLRAANVLKLNDAELPVVAHLCNLTGDESRLLAALAGRYGLRVVALTKGAAGSTLWVDGALIRRPAAPVARVVDTVGAGDAYTAALVMGLLAGHAPERIVDEAHRLAAHVCAQPGATPPVPAELCDLFRPAR